MFFRKNSNTTNEPAGIHKRNQQLFLQLKNDYDVLCHSFLVEDPKRLIHTAQQDKKNNAATILDEWTSSPLQQLKNDHFKIQADDAITFSLSENYKRLRKMFVDAELDFTLQTLETQSAIKDFTESLTDFHAQMQLLTAGSNEPLIKHERVERTSAEEKSLGTFKHNYESLAVDIKKSVQQLFSALAKTTHPKAQENIAGAQNKLQSSNTQEDHNRYTTIIQQEKEHISQDRFQLVNSAFYPLYCDYKNPASYQSDKAWPEFYTKLRQLVFGVSEGQQPDFSKEKSGVQTVVKQLETMIQQYEAMRNDTQYFKTFPEAREKSYQPPRLSK